MTHTKAILEAKKRWAQYVEHSWEDPKSWRKKFSKPKENTQRWTKEMKATKDKKKDALGIFSYQRTIY